eukprot:7013153-Pyramimonas_sp.AAC.1
MPRNGEKAAKHNGSGWFCLHWEGPIKPRGSLERASSEGPLRAAGTPELGARKESQVGVSGGPLRVLRRGPIQGLRGAPQGTQGRP